MTKWPWARRPLGISAKRLVVVLLFVAQLCLFSKEWKLFSSNNSQDVNRPLEKKLTALISVYKQPTCLKMMIDHLRTCPLIAEIRVNWFEEDTSPPPADDDVSNHLAPVKFDQLENKISQRFLPRDDFITDAIFSLDADVFYSCESLELAYSTWASRNNTVVGFHPRNMKEKKKYAPGESLQGPEFTYNTVFITKGGILHKNVLRTYFDEKFRTLREKVDEYITGEDILMSFILANEIQAEVVNICLAAHHTCPMLCHENHIGALNKRTSQHRWPLIQDCFTFFGRNPFTIKQGAQNMIWQQPSDQAQDFCFSEGSTTMVAYGAVCRYGKVCPRKIVPIPWNGLVDRSVVFVLLVVVSVVYLWKNMRNPTQEIIVSRKQ